MWNNLMMMTMLMTMMTGTMTMPLTMTMTMSMTMTMTMVIDANRGKTRMTSSTFFKQIKCHVCITLIFLNFMSVFLFS